MAQQSYKKFVASAATATLVASALIPVASANVTTSAFTDVAAQYKEAVDFVVTNNISSGYSKTQFGVNMQIDRGDAAVWIATAAGLMDKDAPASGFSDVPTRGSLAVNSLKAAGVVNGKTTKNFGFYDKITRGEAAMMLQKAFDLKAESTDANFTDVAAKYKDAVNALVANEVTNGTSKTQFGTNNNIKRGDFAKFLFALKDQINVDKVEVESLKANSTTSFEVKLTEELPTDVEAASALNVKVILADGTVVVPEPTKVELSADRKTITVEHKNNDLAGLTGTLKVNNKELAFDYNTVATVESVKAINSTSLTLTGTGLQNLKVEDIAVEANTVKSVTANATGTSLTVVLDGELRLNEDTKVTVQEKEFTVKYELEAAKAVAVTEATYDDDTARQYLAITVNGKKVTAQELINDGYNLEFVALDKKNASGADISSDLFVAGGTATGELASDLDTTLPTAVGLTSFPTAGIDVYVQVTLTKGTEVLTSELGKVTIKNTDLATDSISGFTLANLGTAFDPSSDDASVDTTPADGLSDAALFVQNSQTLVVGEYGYMNDIEVTTDGNKEDIMSNYSLKTANPAIVSVETDAGGNQVLKARTPGTVNVTVSYGSVTKVIPVKVTNDTREVTRVSVTSNGVTPISTLKTFVAQSTGNRVFVQAYDQNGDPISSTLNVVNSNPTAVDVTSDNAGSAATTVASGDPLYFEGQEKGSATITFKNSIGNKVTSNSFIVQVTENADVSKYGLNVVTSGATRTAIATAVSELSGTPASEDFSTDTNLDNLDDNFIAYTLDSYTSEGLKVATNPIAGNTVTVNQSKIGVLEENTTTNEFYEIVTVSGTEYLVLKANNEVGNATVTIKDANNKTIVNAQRINVTSVGYNVKAAALKSIAKPTFGQVIDYKKVFNYTEVDASKDPVIKGLTLTKASSQPVRLNLGNGSGTEGNLYLDRNADGVFDAGDIVIGSTVLEQTGTFSTPLSSGDTLVDGATIASGDEGTLIIKVLDRNNKVVTSSSVTIDF